MSVKRYNLFAIMSTLFLFMWTEPIMGKSQTIEDLQAAIDNATITRATVADDVDLSPYSGLELDGTLYIREGQRKRFINGSLKAKSGYNGPLVTVQAGGYLELPSGVSLTGVYDQTTSLGLVNVTGGELLISGAEIREGNSDISMQTLICASDPDNSSVSKRSSIRITAGAVVGQIKLSRFADRLWIENSPCVRGIIAQSANNSISLRGKLNTDKLCFYSRTQGKNAHLSIYTKLNYDIEVTAPMGGIQQDNVLAEGVGINTCYFFTESDLKHFKFINDNQPNVNWELYIEDNCVKVRESKGIVDGNTLQQMLDEIAARSPKDPETITIPDEGITISDSIIFRKGCNVILEGGAIKVAKPNYGDVIVNDMKAGARYYQIFSVHQGAIVKFQNITLDFDDTPSVNGFLDRGSLTIGENVTFKNTGMDYTFVGMMTGGFCGCKFFRVLDGYLSYYSGDITCGCVIYATGDSVIKIYGGKLCGGFRTSESTIYCESELLIYGGEITTNFDQFGFPISGNGETSVFMNGGEISVFGVISGIETGDQNIEVDGSESVIEPNQRYDSSFRNIGHIVINGGKISGGIEFKEGTINKNSMTTSLANLRGSGLDVKEKLYISGYCLPTIISSEATVTVGAPVEKSWHISSREWDKVEIGRPIIIGDGNYTLTENDYKNIVLDNVPCQVQPYFDKRDHSVKLINLQWIIDNSPLDNTKEDDEPVEIPVPCDGLNVTNDISLDGLQALIDGKVETEEECEEDEQTIIPSPSVPDVVFPTIKIFRCDGDVTIGKGSYIYFRNICLDGNKGTKKIYVNGTLVIDNYVYIRRFSDYVIHVRPGGRVIWRGGYVEGGLNKIIYNEGGTIIIEGGNINAKDGTSIVNHGDLYIKGGTVEGYVYTYNNIHLCGCANVGEVYLRGGSTIYVTERLTVKIRINVFIDGDLKDGAFIIVGGDGYTLTEDDLKLLELVLPDGYEWEYDSSQHAIIIKSSTGINGVEMDGNADPSDVYSLKGVKVGTTADKSNIPEGIYIIDGKKTNITPRQ